MPVAMVKRMVSHGVPGLGELAANGGKLLGTVGHEKKSGFEFSLRAKIEEKRGEAFIRAIIEGQENPRICFLHFCLARATEEVHRVLRKRKCEAVPSGLGRKTSLMLS